MRDRGTFNFSGNLEVKKDAPLEARSLVNSYADLVKPETWTDEQGGIWKYDCMLVSCKDRPGKVYQLSPGADYTKESSWILIGDTSELNSKVQQFINSKGAPNGLASLNESGIIPSAQLPSYVDDVIEVDTFSNLPGTGESGKIYIVQDTNLIYRWSGTDYVEISKSLALGETSSTAYPGDKGKATTDKLNRIPDKLITDTVNVNQSTTEAVLNFTTYRQEAQQVGRNTLTITSATISQAGLMSSSDKTKLDGLKDQAGITSDINAVQTNLETHINNKSNPHEVTKDQVGLGNVDNTSDANKPISTATQNALNDKFSATEGNTLKQIVNDMPDLVVTGGSLRHNSDSVSLNLIQQNLKNPDDAGSFLLKFNSVTDSTAGIILPSDKSKIDKIITNGNGTKYLSDNGTYKEVSGGGGSGEQYYKINNDKFLPYLRTPAYYKDTDAETAITYVFNTVDKFKEFVDNALDNGYVLELINKTNNEKMYIRDYHVYRSSNGNYELSFIFIYSENNGSDDFALVTTRVFMSYNASNGYKFIVNNLVQSDNLTTLPQFSYDFPLGNKRSIVIINGSTASKTIQINDDTVVLNPKDVWTKSYYDTTPIDVITQTNLEFRMIHSEGNSKNNHSQWIFPDEHLNAQAGNYLLTVSQTYELYLVSVFYIIQ